MTVQELEVFYGREGEILPGLAIGVAAVRRTRCEAKGLTVNAPKAGDLDELAGQGAAR